MAVLTGTTVEDIAAAVDFGIVAEEGLGCTSSIEGYNRCHITIVDWVGVRVRNLNH